MAPTRRETVRIMLSLNRRLAKAHAKDVAIVSAGGPLIELSEGDTLNLGYTFYADYFGDVQAKLEAIERLIADPSIVHKAEIAELEYGRSVIAEVVQSITRIIDAIASGTTHANPPGRPGAAAPNPRRRPRWWPFH